MHEKFFANTNYERFTFCVVV